MTHRKQIISRDPSPSNLAANAAGALPATAAGLAGSSPPLLLFDQQAARAGGNAESTAKPSCTRSVPPVTTLGLLLAPLERLAAPKQVHTVAVSAPPGVRANTESCRHG